MSEYYKAVIFAVVINIVFIASDHVMDLDMPLPSFFDCLLVSFLYRWSDQVDKSNKAKGIK